MAEYISREAAMDAVRRLRIGLRHEGFYKEDLICVEILTRLEAIPAADVAPIVHAHWILIADTPYYPEEECSACHESTKDAGAYCKNCGARMDESEDEK